MTELGVQVVLSFCLGIVDPKMDIPSLAAALRGFETEVVVLHRPYFDWLRSMYSQNHLPMSLEEFAADRILDAAGKFSGSVHQILTALS